MSRTTLSKTTEGNLIIHTFSEVDDCPDMSHLGEYSSKPATVHIDRKERGDWNRGEYEYFNLGAGDAEYIEQDYKRYEDYNRGDWCMLTIGCEISVKTKTNWAFPTVIGRAYLSGVESDSEESYIEQELIAEAKKDLKRFQEEICGKKLTP